MFFFKSAQPAIDENKFNKLLIGAYSFLDSNCAEPSQPKEPERNGHGGDQFSRRRTQPQVQFSTRDDGRFSLDGDGGYDPQTFNISMRNFINGGNISPDSVFKRQVNNSFSDVLIKYINIKGMRDSAVYKAAGIDRRLFSKIISNRDYKPSKNTCIALALALRLNLEDANDFLSRAGYTLSHSIKRDLVIEYCIREKEYSVMYVNELLYRLGMATLNEN